MRGSSKSRATALAVRLLRTESSARILVRACSPQSLDAALAVRVLSAELGARTFCFPAPQGILLLNSSARRFTAKLGRRANAVGWTIRCLAGEKFNAGAQFFAREENCSGTARARRCGGALNQTRAALHRAGAKKFQRLARAIDDRENDSEAPRFLRGAGEKFKELARGKKERRAASFGARKIRAPRARRF
jgi:hypothetical protein